jgi:DNA-binding NtrC family response regulator
MEPLSSQPEDLLIPFSGCSPGYTASLIKSVAGRRVSVLLLGETGTGKSRLAKRIYEIWKTGSSDEEVARVDSRERILNAFLDKQNFGSEYHKLIDEYIRRIPELKMLPTKPVHANLLAAGELLAGSELFGNIPGVFTDVRLRIGRIAEANQGMLFIDELGHVSKSIQAQLLETMEERTVMPLGGMEKHKMKDLDVWYVAALTPPSKPPYDILLPELRYRFDFIFRLSPLRELKEKEPKLIENLANQAIGEAAVRYQKGDVAMDGDALNCLREKAWPGNLRQLASVLKRAVLTATTRTIGRTDIERSFKMDAMGDLGSNELESRLREVFCEAGCAGTHFNMDTVDGILCDEYYKKAGNNKAEAMRWAGVVDHYAFDDIRSGQDGSRYAEKQEKRQEKKQRKQAERDRKSTSAGPTQ